VSDLVLLPGLGADRRLFQEQAAALPVPVIVPDWPAPGPGESLPGFARRVAERLPGPVGVIGGASFGGMVALEAATLLQPKAVVLLGSCTTPAAVAPTLRWLGRFFVRLPERCFRPRPWAAPLLQLMFGQLRSAERRLFWDMVSVVPPGFIRWGCQAILSWLPTAPGVPVFHLHGSADRLIPVRRVRPTQTLESAGHLLNLSHPIETTEFIARVLAEVV
jgi:pimeloyl-ACP methyl ester carboxylesterase